jgi:HPt (histidine-containing phosphotransfer) domain-containing protein
MKRLAYDAKLVNAMDEHLLSLIPIELRHLVPGFVQRREREIDELRLLIEKNDFQSIREIGHRLKGTGGGYGLQLISDLGRDMEKAAVDGNGPRIRTAIDQLAIITSGLKDVLDLENK